MTSLAGILILSSLLRYGKILGLTLVWLGHFCGGELAVTYYPDIVV